MNLILVFYIISASVPCLTQDYVPPTYNPDSQASPTDYYNPNSQDPRYDNPYDPNRKYQGKYDQNQYDPNRNQFDPKRNQFDYDQRFNQFDNRNDPKYQNPYSTENTPKSSWDGSRTYTTSYKSAAAPLENDNVIINEA